MFRRIVTFAAAVALAATSGAAPAVAAPQPPGAQSAGVPLRGTQSPGTRSLSTPAGAQLVWLVDASARVPVPDAEVAAHVAPQLLSAVGGAAGFNALLTQIGPMQLGAVLRDTPTTVQAVVGSFTATVAVDASGLMAGLLFQPYLPAPTSWARLDAILGTLAPRVSFAADRIDAHGACQTLHAVDGATPRPLGSAFKLYVLGALGRAVAAHRLSWDTSLPIHEQWKSLPSGVLQDEPAGTPLTLAQYADYMISISDNTAADHLIHEVGRDAVQRQLTLFGNRDAAADIPFLTTRELFVLKGVKYPATANAYLALPRQLRATALPALDRVPLTGITPWTQPEKIDSLEWFGSPQDMCRAYAGLWNEHQRQIGEALSINDGGIGLDRAAFPTVWFKGGAEPGVATLNYLAQDRHGGLVTASLMLSDPAHPLDEAAALPQALALLRGAVQLAG